MSREPLSRHEHENHYENALARASYYRWASCRSDCHVGNDPINGRPHHWWGNRHHAVRAGRVAYRAMARYWLGVARAIREGGAA